MCGAPRLCLLLDLVPCLTHSAGTVAVHGYPCACLPHACGPACVAFACSLLCPHDVAALLHTLMEGFGVSSSVARHTPSSVALQVVLG